MGGTSVINMDQSLLTSCSNRAKQPFKRSNKMEPDMSDKPAEVPEFPYLWAYGIVFFGEGKGAENWSKFEETYCKKANAPKDTVFMTIGSDPVTINNARITEQQRAEIIAVMQHNGWMPEPECPQPPDECVGDPRTVKNPEGWGE
jgi:hypothetical protein